MNITSTTTTLFRPSFYYKQVTSSMISQRHFSLLSSSSKFFKPTVTAGSTVDPNTVRTFYTYHVPKDTPTIKLSDGSTLIYRNNEHKQELLTSTSSDETTTSNNNNSNDDEESSSTALPPLLHPAKEGQKIYLNSEEIAQARNLRYSHPDRWTVKKLAFKFNCTPETILTYVPDPPQVIEAAKQEYNRWFNNLPWGKKVVAINRLRKKALW